MNGLLLLDKPGEWTSHDCVAKLRSILRERRVGHAGTLDPIATGLLIIFIGRATRAASYGQDMDKEYIAGLRPGIVTDTQDITGRVLHMTPKTPGETEILSAIESFIGEIEQIPPMYSAVRLGGRRLYDLARRGEEIDRPARRVTISGIDYLGKQDSDYLLKIRCSKGTYIRTLCHDIGASLGCGAALSYLRRTMSGGFSVKDARTIDEIRGAVESGTISELVLATSVLFSDYAEIYATHIQEKKCRNGACFSVSAPNGFYRIYGQSGEFLAIAEVKDGSASIIKSFFEVKNA